jgi:hypothetical protein
MCGTPNRTIGMFWRSKITYDNVFAYGCFSFNFTIDTDSSGNISLTQFFKYIIDGEIEGKTAVGKNIIISDFTPSKHTDCSVRGPAHNKLSETIKGMPKKIEPDNEKIQRFENT